MAAEVRFWQQKRDLILRIDCTFVCVFALIIYTTTGKNSFLKFNALLISTYTHTTSMRIAHTTAWSMVCCLRKKNTANERRRSITSSARKCATFAQIHCLRFNGCVMNLILYLFFFVD